jgi:hypothetical protein
MVIETVRSRQMKLLLTIIFVFLSSFVSAIEVQTQKEDAQSEVVLIFASSEGYTEKQIRFKSKEIAPLSPQDEFAFDQRVTVRIALLSKMKNSAVVIENIFETWSEERKTWTAKTNIDKELPEGPNFVHATLKFYDRFGNVLMEKSNDGCNVNIDNNYSYSQQPNVIIPLAVQTFAYSDNGEHFVFCEFCEDGGCFVSSPFRKKIFQLDAMPVFQGLHAFSPNDRYFAYYNSDQRSIIFIDLKVKISTEITLSNSPIRMKAFDDGKLMVLESSTRDQIYYDFKGNKIKQINNQN